MTAIDYVTLEVNDPAAAAAFYETAFGVGDRIRVRASDALTSGFRGFTLSLVVAQPSIVTSLLDSATAAGATVIKPAAKSMWGFGGTVQAPDGTVWTIATSAKKDSSLPTREIDEIVLLLGVDDVKSSKRFYVEGGLNVGKSFGSYTEFDLPASPVKLSLYKRGALAKTAGVDPSGSGSHRLAIASATRLATDPDGFIWEAS